MTDGHLYEYECAKKLKRNGFTKVTVTKGSNDQGIDIIAYGNGEKYGIQCKYYNSPVGNAAVQQAYAGAKYYNCDKAAVMTNTSFTQSAIELSEATGVLLWSHSNIKMHFINRPIYLRILKWIGIFCSILGVLTLLMILTSTEIKFRPLQGFEAIVVIFCGIFTLFEVQDTSLWALPTFGYIVLTILSIIIEILCSGWISKYSFIFLLFSAYSCLCGLMAQFAIKKHKL